MRIESLDIYSHLTSARLPSLPQVLLELLTLCDRDDVGMAEIGIVVSKDAAVAARVVGIANSPYYSPKRSLNDIDQCLAVMGTRTVRRLALNQAVAELFGRFQSSKDFDFRYFWYHGLSVAVTARKLAHQFGYPNEDEAYLAGLLHNVGQLALLTSVTDRYLPMLKQGANEPDLIERERAEFGLSHAEVGAWLARRWNLHSLFADSLLYHHESLERVIDAHALVQIITLSNLLNSTSESALSAHAAGLAHWKLETHQIKDMLASVQAESRVIADELGLELPAENEAIADSKPGNDLATHELASAVSHRMQGMLAQPEACKASEIEDIDAAVRDVLRGASVLFEACGCALFMPEQNMLSWRQLPEDSANGLNIRVAQNSPDSRIAAAYRGRMGLAGLSARPDNLADAQLLRLLNGERLLCLPLLFAGKPLGALAVALNVSTVDHFTSRQALLVTFAREAGKCLGAALRQEDRIGTALLDASQLQERQARNLIHEAGNPLGIVRNYLSVLHLQAANDVKTQEEFGLIENELRRVARILQQFKEPAFSASPSNNAKAAPAPMDINKLTREVAQFCRLGKVELRDIEIDTNLAPDLPNLNISADSLKQILTNLLFNAAEAMAGKGRISLATSLWTVGKSQRYIELSVADNGPGLPPEVQARLFQPVQTRKGDGHSGLGLSIVAKLVDELGGMLQCSSSVSGTQFKILLPVTPKEA